MIIELAKTKYDNSPSYFIDYFKTQKDTQELRAQLCQLADAKVVHPGDVRGFMDFLQKNGNTQNMMTLICKLG